MDISEKIKEAEIQKFRDADELMDAKGQFESLMRGEEPQQENDLSRRYPETTKPFTMVLDEKSRAVDEIERYVVTSNLHKLEVKLMVPFIQSLRDGISMLRLAGSEYAFEISHRYFGIERDIDEMFEELAPSLKGENTFLDQDIGKLEFLEYMYALGMAMGYDGDELVSRIHIKDVPNCGYISDVGEIHLPKDNAYYKGQRFKLVAGIGPHELGHMTNAYNALQHPSQIARAIFYIGTDKYQLLEEAREKHRQIERIRKMGMLMPDLIDIDAYISKENRTSALNFLSYKLRMEGASDLDIFNSLSEHTGKKSAALRTLKSKRLMPNGKAFPGSLVYYAGLPAYRELTDGDERLLQNGRMSIGHVVGDSIYKQMHAHDLVRLHPFISYDEMKIIDIAQDFISR